MKIFKYNYVLVAFLAFGGVISSPAAANAEESYECKRAIRMANHAHDQYDKRVFGENGCIETVNKEWKECNGDRCCQAKANLKAARCVADADSQRLSWLEDAASEASEHCSRETAASISSSRDAARSSSAESNEFVALMEQEKKEACSEKNHSN